jgi:TPR repeat protein
MLGYSFGRGKGCQKDVEKSKENYLIAAELGLVDAMSRLGDLLEKNNPQRFVWLGKAAVSGLFWSFLTEMVEQMCNFDSGTGHANFVFAIGRALKGHIDNEKGEIFRNGCKFDSFIGPATISHFSIAIYRRAVDYWTLIGVRIGVVKDIRKMVATMIWGSRQEAKY